MPCTVRSAALVAKPVAVSVNGVSIAREAIAAEVQQHPSPTPLAAWKAAARALVVRELLLQEARRLAVDATPRTDEAGRRETADEALIRELVEREVNVPDPDEAACRHYFERNRSRFRSPPRYDARHILIAAPAANAAALRAAGEKAAALLAELNDSPERFAKLARAYSDCPSSAQGGSLGPVAQGQLPVELARVLAALEPGELCANPIATRFGLHILRLDRRLEGRDLPFETVVRSIAKYLREGALRRAVAEYVGRLAERATIAGVTLSSERLAEAERAGAP